MKTGGRESQVEREKRGVSRVYLRADGSDGKESACSAGDWDSIPGSGRSPGEGNGNPLQYSYLGKPMDGGAWQATVQGVTKYWTQLKVHTRCPRIPILTPSPPIFHHIRCCSFDPNMD